MDILGIPYIVWIIGGLAMAILWVFIWPKDKNVQKNTLPYYILRWFHSLVWLFLAAAAFVTKFNLAGGKNTAQFLALLGLITYMVFMAAVVTTK